MHLDSPGIGACGGAAVHQERARHSDRVEAAQRPFSDVVGRWITSITAASILMSHGTVILSTHKWRRIGDVRTARRREREKLGSRHTRSWTDNAQAARM